MADPRADPAPRRPPEPPASPAPAPAPGEPVAITLQSDAAPPAAARDDAGYVRNSSFLSRDIEAQKARAERPPRALPDPPRKASTSSQPEGPSPPRRASPPSIKSPPPVNSPLVKSPPLRVTASTPSSVITSPPSRSVSSPPSRKPTPPRGEVTSPPAVNHKPRSAAPKNYDSSNAPRTPWRESPVAREGPVRVEKLSLAATEIDRPSENEEVTKIDDEKGNKNKSGTDGESATKAEEMNGVGDKIKKFEKAAEDATVGVGRVSRAGSVRGRPSGRSERLGSDNSREELPPPATPFKDSVHFELAAPAERPPTVLERQQSLTRSAASSARWQRSDSSVADGDKHRPEPQKIIKPEFKPMPSPVDVTIRSPSLGAKIPDRFPSHGTAFRNVASPDPARARDNHKSNDDVNTQNNIKTCKFKSKDKCSVSKGSSYFTRGSEEIWLVKKKDIEEIEERVLDSFRRAGGNVCAREGPRAASEGGAAPLGGTARRRGAYARSESLDVAWGARAQSLRRQSSACTCHDKKPRARSAADAAQTKHDAQHVLDKYETLV